MRPHTVLGAGRAAAEVAAGSLVAIGARVTGESAYYFVYPERKREYYPLQEFSRWIKDEISPH